MTVPTSKSPVWGITPDEIPWSDRGLVWAMGQDYRTSHDEPLDPVCAFIQERWYRDLLKAEAGRRIDEMRESLLRTLEDFPEPPTLDLAAIEVPPPLPPEDEARLRSRLIGTTRHVVAL